MVSDTGEEANSCSRERYLVLTTTYIFVRRASIATIEASEIPIIVIG